MAKTTTRTTRLPVAKTYKLFINGALTRSESGRYIRLTDHRGRHACNLCRSSRKDLRNAVVAARKALPGWSGRTAYNRSQILYRMAEALESRDTLFRGLLTQFGETPAKAKAEFTKAVDRLVYFAGWCDKYQQIFSSVNPVSSRHFNFSFPEPTGVVALAAPDAYGLLGLVSLLAPVLAGGNTCVMVAGRTYGAVAVEFAEVIMASDVPSGVINLLTGNYDELAPHMAAHMDINAMVSAREKDPDWKALSTAGAENVKRMFRLDEEWLPEGENPYRILDLQEIKTTWHPVGN